MKKIYVNRQMTREIQSIEREGKVRSDRQTERKRKSNKWRGKEMGGQRKSDGWGGKWADRKREMQGERARNLLIERMNREGGKLVDRDRGMGGQKILEREKNSYGRK